jgi:hypothetical protein
MFAFPPPPERSPLLVKAQLLYDALVSTREHPTEENRRDVQRLVCELAAAGKQEGQPIEKVVARIKKVAVESGWYQVSANGWSHPDGDTGDLLQVDLVRLCIKEFFRAE